MKSHLSTAFLSTLVACVPAEMPVPSQGHALFLENCAVCHGDDATGNGWAGTGLVPPPSDLTRISQRNGGTFPVARVLSTIDGYTRDATPDLPGQDMPEFGLLLQGDSVPVDTGGGIMTPTPLPLAALLAYLESIQE